MSFSEKAQEVFYKDLGLNNRQIAEKMDNYSESLVSRYMNSPEPSTAFVKRIKKYFPELAYIDWFDNDSSAKVKILQEKSEEYRINTVEKIDRIIKELGEIKESLS